MFSCNGPTTFRLTYAAGWNASWVIAALVLLISGAKCGTGEYITTSSRSSCRKTSGLIRRVFDYGSG